ncbi:unnamed protein product [Knipowitschia caucasica]
MSSQGLGLRALVAARLAAAADDIFALFERTVAEYEEQLGRLQEQSTAERVALNPGEGRAGAGSGQEKDFPVLLGDTEVKEEPEEHKVCMKTEDLRTPCRDTHLLYTRPDLHTHYTYNTTPLLSHLHPETKGETRVETREEDSYIYSTSVEAAEAKAQLHNSLGHDRVSSCGLVLTEQTSDQLLNVQGGSELYSSYLDSQADSSQCVSGAVSWTAPFSCSEQGAAPFSCSEEGAAPLSCSEQGPACALKRHQCEECPRTFVSRSHLERHRGVHSGEKPFSCSFCGKSFNTKGYLVVHTRTHTGERPYSCQLCSKGFSHRSAYNFHLQTHRADRRFVCALCGKSFTVEAYLKVHMKTHSGERPYECALCGRRFGRANVLKSHMKIHSDEKPFSCSQCGHSFTHKHNLEMHRRTHRKHNT